MIDMRDAMRAVLRHRRGDVVLSTETSIGAWAEVSDDETLDLPIPAMSKGSSMALGVALAQPQRRVIVWDGDGCLLMNLGTLVTIAGQAPAQPVPHRAGQRHVRHDRRTARAKSGQAELPGTRRGRGLRQDL